MRFVRIFLLGAVLISLLGCRKDKVVLPGVGLSFNFSHWVGTSPLQLNQLQYVNEAGNQFSVTKLQYIVSDIQLASTNGEAYKIAGYHFVDFKDASTFTYVPNDKIASGEYTSISFVLGLTADNNVSGAYPDLNAVSWGWPDASSGGSNLGGGYHFMKLEGKYLDGSGAQTGFATHMGTAREITTTDTIFHQNFIEIDLAKSFNAEESLAVEIKMDLLEWYKNPVMLDFNDYSGSVMPNYFVQTTLHQNGASAFSLGTVK